MKKTILVFAASISIVVVYAQENKASVAPPPPPAAPVEMVAPPPPPSAPAVAEMVKPPAPPAPPVPPPPPPPVPAKEKYAVIVNDHGNEISIRKVKGIDVVFIEKAGRKTQRIRLETWNAKRKFYEKYYGQLPPVVAEEKTVFTPPIITKDN